jgi:hypothetical protein
MTDAWDRAAGRISNLLSTSKSTASGKTVAQAHTRRERKHRSNTGYLSFNVAFYYSFWRHKPGNWHFPASYLHHPGEKERAHSCPLAAGVCSIRRCCPRTQAPAHRRRNTFQCAAEFPTGAFAGPFRDLAETNKSNEDTILAHCFCWIICNENVFKSRT